MDYEWTKAVLRKVFDKTDAYRRLLQGKCQEGMMAQTTKLSFDQLMALFFSTLDDLKEINVLEPHKRKYEIRLRFVNFAIGPPQVRELDGTARTVLPNEMRLRRGTYAGPLTCDASIEVFKVHEDGTREKDDSFVDEAVEHKTIGMLPIMTGSRFCNLVLEGRMDGECATDGHGYFIIRGHERIVQSINEVRSNKPVVTSGPKGLVADVRSQNPSRARHSATFEGKCSSDGLVSFMIQFTAVQIPLRSMLRLLQVETLEDQRLLIFPETGGERLGAIDTSEFDDPHEKRIMQVYSRAIALMETNFLLDTNSDLTVDALATKLGTEAKYTSSNVGHALMMQLRSECLPHCGSDDAPETVRSKSVYIGWMARRLLLSFVDDELFPLDDMENVSNRSLNMLHHSVSILYRRHIQTYIKKLRQTLLRKLNRDCKSFGFESELSKNTLTKAIEDQFVSGEIVTEKKQSNATSGVIQILETGNEWTSEAHKSKHSKPMASAGRYMDRRLLHSSEMFINDPSATPEGDKIGKVLAVPLCVHVRLATDTTVLFDLVRRVVPGLVEPYESPLQFKDPRVVGVWVNFCPVGVTVDPGTLAKELRIARRKQWIPQDTSIVQAPYGISIEADDGVQMFPTIRLDALEEIHRDPGPVEYQAWKDKGYIELMSPCEAQEGVVVHTWGDVLRNMRDHPADKWGGVTHMAIHPSMMLGMLSSMIPWISTNAAARATLTAAMLPQAMGVPRLNMIMHGGRAQFPNLVYSLTYPQKPLAVTDAERAMGMMPQGQVPLVAFIPHEQNPEDALVFKKEYFERGGMHCMMFRTEYSMASSKTVREVFCHPLMTDGVLERRKDANYDKIGADGFPNVGTWMNDRDVLIGKTAGFTEIQVDGSTREVFRDVSHVFRSHQPMVVDDVCITNTTTNSLLVTVRLRCVKHPEVGDKFASRHGQKGTVGKIEREVDMWTIADGDMAGVAPDILMSSSAIPSRMTVGQMMEMMSSWLGLSKGQLVDATPWVRMTEDGDWIDEVPEMFEAAIAQASRVFDDKGDGKFAMMDGKTGELVQGRVAMGFVFYMRLMHLVSEKVRARARGPRSRLTKQPEEGKYNAGGIRMEEMAQNVVIGYGAAETVHGRLVDASDGDKILVCGDCGAQNSTADSTMESMHEVVAKAQEFPVHPSFASYRSNQLCWCCGSPNVVFVQSVATARLLQQELSLIGVDIRIDPRKSQGVSIPTPMKEDLWEAGLPGANDHLVAEIRGVTPAVVEFMDAIEGGGSATYNALQTEITLTTTDGTTTVFAADDVSPSEWKIIQTQLRRSDVEVVVEEDDEAEEDEDDEVEEEEDVEEDDDASSVGTAMSEM